MRISDWSSDVCSSDLLLPSFSCSVPGQFLPFLMDAAAFQFAQLRIAAHSSHKLIEHLKESPAQQQDKKDNGGIQQWQKGMRLKGDMELNRDTQNRKSTSLNYSH